MRKRSTLARRTLVVTLTIGAAVLTGQSAANAGPESGVVGPTLFGERAGTSWHHVLPESAICVQMALGLPTDGQYGPQTFDAVQEFQAANGLTVDGVVGRDTGDRLIGRLPGQWYASCYYYLPTTFVLTEPGEPAPTLEELAVEPDETTMSCAGETFKDSMSPKKAFKIFKVFKKGERASVSDVIRHPAFASIRIMSCVRHGP